MPRHPPEHPPFDRDRILATLDRHRVEYLLVGGVAASSHGATLPTYDFDCLTLRTLDNLTRLGAAMRELNARVRAEGLDDDTAKALPTMLDAKFLGGMEISTWRTDAGDFDVLTDMPNQLGIRLRYEDLVGRAERHRVGNIDVTVASLEDIIASKEWANRPKDHRALPELRAIARSRPLSSAADSHGPDTPAPS